MPSAVCLLSGLATMDATPVWARLREGEDLKAMGGHQDGVLPLGRQAVILCDDGPAIGKLTDFLAACVDHGLNGKGHALRQLQSGALSAVMQDLRILMEDPANAVSAEFTNH